MSLIDSKSLLAKLMATEDLTVEQRKVSTAYFDVKNRVLVVPILDNNISPQLYDLFMGHEVGHALYTPLESMRKARESKVNMGIVNVVEDSRIERKIKHKYPGLKNSFFKAYGELVSRNFFETQGKDLNALNFIDRINLHCKGGALLAIKFTDIERELLNAVESTETYEEVVDVSKRIVEYMRMVEEEKQKNVDVKVKVVFESDEDEDDAPSEDNQQDVEDVDVEDAPEPKGSANTEDGDSEDEEKSEKTSTKVEAKPEKTEEEKKQDIEDAIRSFTDEAYKKNENKLFIEDERSYVYVNVPKIDINRIMDHKQVYKQYAAENYPFDVKEFVAFRRESNKVVSYLVKEFELRKNADQLKRASTAKTGDLDMSKIFSYQFSEDIFKKVTVVPGGKSHGLVMFLDWSGSMVNHIGNTVKQLLNLVMFCKKVNIPFEVYCFVEDPLDYHTITSKAIKGDIAFRSFGLANLLSNRMTPGEFQNAAGALMHMAGIGSYHRPCHAPTWLRMQGTPLNETIFAAMEIVPKFQKMNKLQVVNTVFLTDGEGHYLPNYYTETSQYAPVKDFRTDAYGYRSKHTTVVLRDPETKHQEEFTYDQRDGLRMQQTNACIRLLKKRTGSHVIGFFIAASRDLGNQLGQFYPEHSFTQKEMLKESFRKEKYLVVNNTGFDDYYVLRSNGLDTDEDSELVIKDNATTRGIVSAFSKYTGGRVNNRVILNRFISLIS
jgi:hypothetical protein